MPEILLRLDQSERMAESFVLNDGRVADTLVNAEVHGIDRFLEEGICSVVVTMQDGVTVEVGILGCDGFVGVPAMLGTGHSPNRSFIQIPGHGFSIKASVLRAQAQASIALLSMLQRSIQGLMVQTAQTAACNRVHELHERLARGLLTIAWRRIASSSTRSFWR